MRLQRLDVFRSLWGLERRLTAPSALATLLRQLKAKGYTGVEASLADARAAFASGAVHGDGSTRGGGGGGGGFASDDDAKLAAFAAALRDSGLELVLGTYSSWDDYVGDKEYLPPAVHKDRLRRQVHGCCVCVGGWLGLWVRAVEGGACEGWVAVVTWSFGAGGVGSAALASVGHQRPQVRHGKGCKQHYGEGRAYATWGLALVCVLADVKPRFVCVC